MSAGSVLLKYVVLKIKGQREATTSAYLIYLDPLSSPTEHTGTIIAYIGSRYISWTLFAISLIDSVAYSAYLLILWESMTVYKMCT